MKFSKHRIRRNCLYRGYMFMKARYRARMYRFPSDRLICYGITGTDGKSTTSILLYHLLKQGGKKVGLLSTVFVDFGAGLQDNTTKLTSMSHDVFQSFMRKAVDNGLEYMVIEASSHSLYQFRMWPAKCVGVGMTNISREHLDFHWTMEHYFKTKLRLFCEYIAHRKNSRETPTRGVIGSNLHFKELARSLASVEELWEFGYSQENDIRVSDIKESPQLSFVLHMGEKIPVAINMQMVGRFNAENAMIASVLADHSGIPLKDIKRGLESFGGVPGRQEMVVGETGVTVMIDFALTPDALATVYQAVRGMGFDKQIAVFGATGDRDQGKRPLMGEVAMEFCDHVIITEDENYHENGMDIMKAVESGIAKELYSGCYTLVQDRTKAISHALKIAGPNDIIVLTGMANFSTRIMNEGSIPRNERAVVENCMKELGK